MRLHIYLFSRQVGKVGDAAKQVGICGSRLCFSRVGVGGACISKDSSTVTSVSTWRITPVPVLGEWEIPNTTFGHCVCAFFFELGICHWMAVSVSIDVDMGVDIVFRG